MGKKITNKEVDELLINRPIKRLGEYINKKTKIKFQCLIEDCNYIWTTAPYSILIRGTGCPNCVDNSKKVTNEQLDIILVGRNIERLDCYINSYTHLNFQCLNKKCNHIWLSTPNSIINGKSGCPKCAHENSISLTSEEFDEKIKNLGIIRIDEYLGGKIPINFQCTKCKYIFKTFPRSLSHDQTTCAKCWGNAKLTNNDIDIKLINRNIQRIGNFVNNKAQIDFKCLICNFIWPAAPTDVLNKLTGCPKCQSPKSEGIIIKIFERYNIEYVYQKRIQEINNLFPKLKVDFYFPSINIIIEYNGTQHYKSTRFGGISQERADDKFAKQRKRDKLLRKTCKDNNIILICIDGRKYKHAKLEKYIIKKIIPMIKNDMI
jgi:hypothetical protein